MRLYNYLNEDEGVFQFYNPSEKETLKKAWDIIQKDCKPFLKDIRNARNFLYRGMKEQKNFVKKKVRTDRSPMNTPEDLHELYDRYFKEKFGWNARSNAVFANGNSLEASQYGREFMIFPIGNYKFVWSPEVEDLFVNPITRGLKRSDERNNEGFYQKVKEELDSVNYTDKNMALAIRSKNEIMIGTESYYALNVFFEPAMGGLVFKGSTLDI